MAFLQAGTPSIVTNATKNLTVPSGITPAHVVLVMATGTVPAPTATALTVNNASAVVTTFLPLMNNAVNTLSGQNIGNEFAIGWKVTGVTAGNVFTMSLTAASQSTATHYYFDSDLSTPTAMGSRNSVSSAVTTIPALTVPAGSSVMVFAAERSLAIPTTISSVANSNSRTVIQRDLVESDSPGGSMTHYLGEFTEATTSTGSTTITYSGASGNGFGFYSIESAPPPPPPSDPTLLNVTKQITVSNDDGVWSVANGYFNTATATLKVGDSTTTDYDRAFYMRFSGLGIPKGATIVSALVNFTTAGGSSSVYPFLSIKAEATDNATTITSLTDVQNRTRSATTVPWHPTVWSVSGNPASTSDISAIIQQIVNRPGWASGNAINLFVEETTTDGWTGTITDLSVNSSESTSPANSGPTLVVNYRVGGSGFTAQSGVALYQAGTEVALSAHYWTGTEEVPVAKNSQRYRINTVSNTLDAAHQPFYVAHRGGSGNWPESTRYAARQAAVWPVRAIEISAFLSSDGVWVSSHDQTTTRITGVNYDIPTTPWSTMSTLTVAPPAGNPNQPRQPLSRVVDILDDFARDHVIFIEDKSYKNTASLLALIQQYPDYADHFIWKHYGPSTGTGPTQAKALGMKSWAYYFTGSDMTNLFGTGASNSLKYDYLGIDSACTDAEMNQLVALNRPFTSHILTTTAQRDRMRGFGAIGHMCADIITVVPPQR